MAQIFCIISVGLLILLSCICLGIRVYYNSKKEYMNVLMPNNYLLITGILCGAVLTFFVILSYLQEASWGYGALFCIFVWLCIIMLLGWLEMLTIYDENGFTRGVLPGMKCSYRYEELTGYKSGSMKISFLKGRKKITYEPFVIDCLNFQWYVLRQYKLKTGKELKEDRSIPKWDIFNGHVENSGEIIVIYGLVLVGLIGFAIWMFVDANKIITEEETIYIESEITTYWAEENELVLDLENVEGKFVIQLYQDYGESIDELLMESRNDQTFFIHAYELGTVEGQVKYGIYSISSKDGQSYLTFDEANRVSRENAYEVLIFFAVMIVLILVVLVGTIIVGRNPHKFSKRVQRLFFKDGYLK